MNNIIFLFVTLFGIGKLKKIPGSYASLVTTIFLFFIFHILNFSANIVLIGKEKAIACEVIASVVKYE